MKHKLVLVMSAVALTAGLVRSQATDLISNLGELWAGSGVGELRTPYPGTAYGTAFTAGGAGFEVQSITVEQWFFDPAAPQDLRLRLLEVFITPETGEINAVPLGEFGTPVVDQTPTQWPEWTTFVTYSSPAPILLEPASLYLVAVADGGQGLEAPTLVFTPSTGFTGLPGAQLGGDYFGISFGPDEFWFENFPGHLKFSISGNPLQNRPPDVSNAQASLPVLWPPNGDFVSFDIQGVTDADGDSVTISILAIQQDEPVRGRGDKTAPDAIVETDAPAQVRAERLGNGNGRVYTVFFAATDGKAGGTAEGVVFIQVPHDQGQDASAIDDGPQTGYFDSTAAF